MGSLEKEEQGKKRVEVFPHEQNKEYKEMQKGSNYKKKRNNQQTRCSHFSDRLILFLCHKSNDAKYDEPGEYWGATVDAWYNERIPGCVDDDDGDDRRWLQKEETNFSEL